MATTFLSYTLSEQLSGYANSQRISVSKERSISEGDTSNNSKLIFPAHYGTHIDFPFHFDNKGKKGDQYPAAFFVSERIAWVDVSNSMPTDFLLTENDLNCEKFPRDVEFILFKTGFGNKRSSDEYWNANWGFHPDTAVYLRGKFPELRAIGFDLMSVSSFRQRATGRIAHKEFLINNNLLLIEDMNLSELEAGLEIRKLTLAPLRYSNADGCPVTVIADIETERTYK